jgi:trehalose 6-phosphate synthase/phosphatase
LDLGIDWASVEGVALRIMAKFTARTNGSFIKRAHSSIGWSYYSCDPEFGSLQAKYLVIELERELAAFDVRFVHLKGIVEVIPRKLNKGIIVKKILRDVAARNNNAGVDFILCMGDDISDEKMFTSVFSFISEMDEDYANVVPSPPVIQLSQGILEAQPFLVEKPVVRCNNQKEKMFAFTVSVGKKESHASQYVDDARDVADLLVKLSSGKRASYRRETDDEIHRMQFS